MKKNKFIIKATLVIATVGLLISGCKKTTETITTSTDNSSTQAAIALDELNVNNEMDQLIDETVLALNESPETNGTSTANHLIIMGATIDTTQADSGIIYVDYFGKEPNNPSKSRSGNVEIKLPVVGKHVIPWTTKGVTATITIPIANNNGYEIFYDSQGKITLWFTGSFTVTNVSGGTLSNLATGDSLVEQVRGPVSYTTNDNIAKVQLYVCNFCKTRVFYRADASNVTITTRGDTAIGGFNNLSNWGKTRFSQSYYTTITERIVQNTADSAFYHPLSGVKFIQAIPEPITDTLGVNNLGFPVISNNPYGYKINWTNTGPQSLVISY